jgi:hypothetical protein
MSNNKLAVAALITVAALAVTVPFIGHAENSGSALSQNLARTEMTHNVDATVGSADDEPRVVSLQVNPSGFEPGETILPSGTFLIFVQNRTGSRELSFYLIRENQERLAESEPQKRDWKAQIQLGPGTYVIGERSHREWKSILRVTN